MKTLVELFNVKKGDVISIVGTGGKTTLMYQMGNELRNLYKLLLTTSTKIIKPSNENYDYIYTCMEDYINDKTNIKIRNCGIILLSSAINNDNNKLIGIEDNDLHMVINDFDIAVIEADGSRKLPLKGWKKHEPKVLLQTNKTIGVFPVKVLGEKINSDEIYNYEEFVKFSKNKNIIDNEVVGRICSEKCGIFKNSRGLLYLYINNADNDEELNKAFKLAEYLKNFIVGKPYDFKICIGSLKRGVFYEY